MPGCGEQRTLFYKPPGDLFFIRPLLSRARNVANFPNTQKQTQIIGQNEETKEHVPDE